MKITVLADNTVAVRDMRGEHGLAYWIDTGENSLLFDTGQGLVLADNAQALHLDLDAVDTIVLSHGHYDHTGGLVSVLRQTTNSVALHAHPGVLLPKYQQGEKGCRDISMPKACREALLGGQCRFIPSRGSVEVAPNVYATGEIPRLHPEEAITESFCCDPEGRKVDLLWDDQALFIKTARGPVVLLGCAHSGLINTLDHIQGLTQNKPIRALIGGMHLRSANEERIQWTIQELRRFNLNLLAPMHCTGPKAIAKLWAAFPLTCQAVGVGTSFVF